MTRSWGGHLRTLHTVDGLATVRTSVLDGVELRVLEAALHRSLCVVTGDCGTGKSFSVGRAADLAATRIPGLEIVWLELAGTTKGRQLMFSLGRQLMPAGAKLTGTEWELRNQLREELTARRLLLVIDEGERIAKSAMGNLRWMLDDPDGQFGMVLIGTSEMRLPPELKSRASATVRVPRIDDADAPKLLSGFHPFFARQDPKLLEKHNRIHARGEWRAWAHFLRRAVDYLDGEPLDAETAEDLWYQTPGGSR